MTGSLLPFDTSEHAAADVLLPFYVNATLRGEELEFVEQHVQSCEQCRREAEWLRTVYAACAASPAMQAAAAQVLPESANEHAAEDRQRKWPRRVVAAWQSARAPVRWLVAAQIAAIVVLSTLLVVDTRDAPSYRTLGAPYPSAQMRAGVAVMFDPAITESEIRRTLQAAGARIVDGPLSTGVFLLDIPAERLDQALATLRAERGVRLAERLGPAPGR